MIDWLFYNIYTVLDGQIREEDGRWIETYMLTYVIQPSMDVRPDDVDAFRLSRPFGWNYEQHRCK